MLNSFYNIILKGEYNMKKKTALLLSAFLAFSSVFNTFGATYYAGDVNMDNAVTSTDATKVLQKILNSSYTLEAETTLGENYLLVADANGDGEFNVNDASAILQYALSGEYKTVSDDEVYTIDLSALSSLASNNAYTVSYSDDANVADNVTINLAGTYIITGGSESNPVKNVTVTVSDAVSDAVNITLDNVNVDNSAYTADTPVIAVNTASAVTFLVKGSNSLTGYGAYTSKPASGVIYDSVKKGAVSFIGADNSSTLNIKDAMPATTSYTDSEGNELDPTDGISSKGGLTIASGIYSITSNGDCLKGTNSGVDITGGTYNLTSVLGAGIKSKSSYVNIESGSLTINSGDDGLNSKNGTVKISGGTVDINECGGDGIQAENVEISGGNIDIETVYDMAGYNYYYSGYSVYNTRTESMSQSGTTKTEVINIDTGSHKGIKAGTKAKTYYYDTDTTNTANTDVASGGITITGGTVNIDTTKTGLKANSVSASDSTIKATGTGVYIIGAPDDGISSNNTCQISGGTITVAASDKGIRSIESLDITGNASVTINHAYEGIETGLFNIGTSGSTTGPEISLYTMDDGVNASKKALTYYYTDEDEETYKKISVSSSTNAINLYSGILNVMIADDTTHSVTLPNGSGKISFTYSANGDGIDCNGSFYAYGGTALVYGANSNDNSPVDCDGTYQISNGANIIALGSSGMIENPTSLGEYAVTFSGSSGGMGGMVRPGQQSSSSSVTIAKGSSFAILDQSGNVLVASTAPKQLNYVLYASPNLTGSTYTLSYGGSVSGNKVTALPYDYRYSGYSTSGASSTTATASNTASGGGQGFPGQF